MELQDFVSQRILNDFNSILNKHLISAEILTKMNIDSAVRNTLNMLCNAGIINNYEVDQVIVGNGDKDLEVIEEVMEYRESDVNIKFKVSLPHSLEYIQISHNFIVELEG